MKNFSYILLFLIYLHNKIIDAVSRIRVESIVGGFKAAPDRFKYQVAIVTKENQTNYSTLACGGGIIGENLILSAAECFVNDDGILRNYEFSIIADTIHFKLVDGIEILIDVIYLPSGGNYYLNNIAVAKLTHNLGVANNPHLSILFVSDVNRYFLHQGIVAGYGYSLPLKVIREDDSENSFRLNSENILKYSKVLITTESNCGIGLTKIDTKKQFCVIMLTIRPGQVWGLCEKDAGSPLVIKNEIVGIAGLNHPNCNDTVYGVAYTQVSAYSGFINSVIRGNPLPDTLIHHNPRHVPRLVASAA